jgi:hypothetical protein
MKQIKYLIIALVFLATQNTVKAQSAYVTKSDSMRIDSIFNAKSDSIWKAVEKIKITKTSMHLNLGRGAGLSFVPIKSPP